MGIIKRYRNGLFIFTYLLIKCGNFKLKCSKLTAFGSRAPAPSGPAGKLKHSSRPLSCEAGRLYSPWGMGGGKWNKGWKGWKRKVGEGKRKGKLMYPPMSEADRCHCMDCTGNSCDISSERLFSKLT